MSCCNPSLKSGAHILYEYSADEGTLRLNDAPPPPPSNCSIQKGFLGHEIQTVKTAKIWVLYGPNDAMPSSTISSRDTILNQRQCSTVYLERHWLTTSSSSSRLSVTELCYSHKATKSKIKVTILEATEEVTFQGLTEKYLKAEEALLLVQKQAGKKSDLAKEANEVVKKARVAVDKYNRYSIAVRGSSSDVYGILREANVETEFASLLRTTESGHNAWMLNYVARKSGDLMDVDS